MHSLDSLIKQTAVQIHACPCPLIFRGRMWHATCIKDKIVSVDYLLRVA